MPYAYLAARALPVKPGAQWKDIDLSQTLVYQIFLTYREIALTLDRAGETVHVDMNQLRAMYGSYNNTLTVLLMSIGEMTLDTMVSLPGGKMDYIEYSDAVRIGYSYKLGKIGQELPENYPRDEKTDLQLFRYKYPTDIGLVHSHALVSVNGFYHMTDSDTVRAWVKDGGRSIQKANYGHIGLTSFLKVGKLTKQPIDPTTVQPVTLEEGLGNGLIFSTDLDLTDKSYFLVLGGYLVFPQDNVFWQSGEKEFRLRLEGIPFLERVLESKSFIDLSPLELTESELNENNVNLEELWSDDVIRRYLSLSQSFLVVVDRKDLFINKLYLRQAMIPGIFTAYQEPKYPLFVGHGRTAEYWKVFEDGHWAVTVTDSWVKNYIFNRQRPDTLENVSDQLAMDRPFFYSQGLMLEIGAPSQA